MALLKYFKIEKRGPLLPDPSGLLNQHLSSSAIEEANKEVTAVLGDPAKRHSPYLKISPEQKAIIMELLMLLDRFRKTFQRIHWKYDTWMEEDILERIFFLRKLQGCKLQKFSLHNAHCWWTAKVFPLEYFDVYGICWTFYINASGLFLESGLVIFL